MSAVCLTSQTPSHNLQWAGPVPLSVIDGTMREACELSRYAQAAACTLPRYSQATSLSSSSNPHSQHIQLYPWPCSLVLGAMLGAIRDFETRVTTSGSPRTMFVAVFLQAFKQELRCPERCTGEGGSGRTRQAAAPRALRGSGSGAHHHQLLSASLPVVLESTTTSSQGKRRAELGGFHAHERTCLAGVQVFSWLAPVSAPFAAGLWAPFASALDAVRIWMPSGACVRW